MVKTEVFYLSTEEKKEEFKHTVSMFNKYKDLLMELTRKNVKLKYRNSWLGIFWSFLQPLLNMIVLSVIFGALLGRKKDGIVCYPVYLFSGRLIYEFFVTSTKQSLTAFRRNASIIKKVYVPKYMYPLSSTLSTFVTFAISTICYVCVWLFFKITGFSGGSGLTLSWKIVLVFLPMILLLMFSTGVGLILSVVNVYFRDVEYIWDVCTKLFMYMVPILYSMNRFEGRKVMYVIKLNPLYSMIELFRQCILYGDTVPTQLLSWKLVLYATVMSIASLAVGIFVFNKYSDKIVYHL